MALSQAADQVMKTFQGQKMTCMQDQLQTKKVKMKSEESTKQLTHYRAQSTKN